MEQEQSEDKQKPIVTTLFSELTVFFLVIFLIYIGFLFVVKDHWSIFQSFFMYFDDHSSLAVTLKNSIISLLISPNIQNISIFIAIVTIFSMLSQEIKTQGHVFFENTGIEGKYFQSLFTTLNVISIIIVPIFTIFLFYCQSYSELVLDILVIIFNMFLSTNIIKNWAKITQQYDDFVSFNSSNKKNIVFQSRDLIASIILFLILSSSLYFLFFTNFNLVSITFIEISFFIAYFIFCSVTHNQEGPVDVFLIDAQTVFREAYIFEDSPYKGYLYVILRNSIKKKIMKSSILYLEPSNPKNDDPKELVKVENNFPER